MPYCKSAITFAFAFAKTVGQPSPNVTSESVATGGIAVVCAVITRKKPLRRNPQGTLDQHRRLVASIDFSAGSERGTWTDSATASRITRLEGSEKSTRPFWSFARFGGSGCHDASAIFPWK